MWDKEMVYDLIELIIENLEIVQHRTKGINKAQDFSSSDNGMILLDSTCMKLAAIGESIKNLDKISNKRLLVQYPEVPWKQVMGMRDIIVHNYFDIDAEVISSSLLLGEMSSLRHVGWPGQRGQGEMSAYGMWAGDRGGLLVQIIPYPKQTL